MYVEGKGVVAPTPVKRRITEAALKQLAVYAEQRAAYRDYENRRDKWGRGLIRNRPMPVVGMLRAGAMHTFWGSVGEEVVSAYFNRRGMPSYAPLRFGDNHIDMTVNGVSVQVKTRGYRGRSLVRRVSETGRIIPLTADVFVFCEWQPNQDPYSVLLLGWVPGKDMPIMTFGKSHRGGHFNLIVPDTTLLPMSRLQDRFANNERRRNGADTLSRL